MKTKDIEDKTENRPGFDAQFTGNFPRYSGAKSAITGGPPEDMNGMPATLDPEEDGLIWDGSDLSTERSAPVVLKLDKRQTERDRGVRSETRPLSDQVRSTAVKFGRDAAAVSEPKVGGSSPTLRKGRGDNLIGLLRTHPVRSTLIAVGLGLCVARLWRARRAA